MKTEKVSFEVEGKKFCVRARRCGVLNSGLMVRTAKTVPCVFRFDKPSDFKITSMFVFFPFIAVWLDKLGEVIETRKVEPFTVAVSCKKKYHILLEIPVNKKYSSVITALMSFSRR